MKILGTFPAFNTVAIILHLHICKIFNGQVRYMFIKMILNVDWGKPG